MKRLSFAVLAVCAFAGCVGVQPEREALLGRYQPFEVDAGSSLHLLEKGVFVCDWWWQDMRNGNILSGWTSGSWHREGSSLVLRYVTNKKQSEAVFMIDQREGKPLLKLVREGEFPFDPHWGDYSKEQEHAETLEMSLQAIQRRKKEKPNQAPEPTPPSGAAHL